MTRHCTVVVLAQESTYTLWAHSHVLEELWHFQTLDHRSVQYELSLQCFR